MSRVERRVTALEIQWADTLDRLKTMMGRLLKERARTERAAERLGDSEENNAGEMVTEPSNPSGMTPGQMAAQQRILARRNRMRGMEQ